MPKKPKSLRNDPEAKEQLRADRDDALGYSREQFTFEKPGAKKAKKKPSKNKSRKAK